MNHETITCVDCDDLFPDWFENELGDEAQARMQAHVASCARCSGLVRDIETIAGTARALPDLAPSRELWQGIEQRIQPSVISIGAPRPVAIMSRGRMAAAAAALVVVTSSITYVATAKSVAKRPVARPAAAAAQVRIAGATVDAEAPPAAPVSEPASSGSARAASVPVAGTTAASRARLASRAVGPAPAPATAGEMALALEIGRLQLVLRNRRSELEPQTVTIVEQNLAIIDEAVAQARAALARDPASGFLSGRLENALQKKVNLLRAAATLPSAT